MLHPLVIVHRHWCLPGRRGGPRYGELLMVMAAMTSAAVQQRGMLRSSMTIATLSTSIIERRRDRRAAATMMINARRVLHRR